MISQLSVRKAVVFFVSCGVLVGAARAEAETERPRLELLSANGQHALRFNLAAQLQFAATFRGLGPEEDLQQDYGVFFRRIRPIVSGHLFGENLTYRLHLNVVPGSLELMDLWIAYEFHPQVRLLVGQNKVPFTLYRTDSFQDLPFVDWSLETRWFGAERQMGAVLHNGFPGTERFEYEVGLYTGQNARGSNAVGMSQVFGERPPNPSSLVEPDPWDVPHPEVVAHFGYNHNGIDRRRPSDLEGGPFRFLVGMSGAWDFRPVARRDWSLRLAPEFLLKAYGWSLQGVLYLAFWNEVTGEARQQLGSVGTVMETTYFFAQRYEIGLRYCILYLTPALRRDARRYGEAQIAAAEDEEDAAKLAGQYGRVGRTWAEQELNLGFTVHLIGTTLKLQIDGGLLYHNRVGRDGMDVRARTQLQLAF